MVESLEWLGGRHPWLNRAAEARAFWDETKHEFEAYVTNLTMADARPWQCVELYRRRAECENVFNELKNHWGFNGFCCKKPAATALATRLLLLSYNLWNLFLRLMQPERHVEAFQGRRWFLLIACIPTAPAPHTISIPVSLRLSLRKEA